MQSTRILGQQLNAVLIVLTLGLLAPVVLFDVAAIVSGVDLFARVAHWTMGAGVLAGLVALTVALVDVVTAPAETMGRPVLGVVSAATTAMVVLFAGVWWLRADRDPADNAGLLALELLALGAGVVGAWFARRLVAGRGVPPPRRAPARARRRPYRPLGQPTTTAGHDTRQPR